MRTPLVVASSLLLLTLAGCGGSSSSSTAQPPASLPTASPVTSSSAPGGSSTAAPDATYYVSIGDSYAAGYQATGKQTGGTTTNGFAYQVVTQAKAEGEDLTLVNFGCSGATTESILKTHGCAPVRLGPGAEPYDSMTQAEAAEAFLKAHQGHVALITVSVGGNDVIACGADPDALGCLTKTLTKVDANLKTLLTGLRTAAGPDTQIVGTTYPDVLLAGLLGKDPAAQGLAKLSTVAFKDAINPQLKSAYEAAGGTFVDVTAATGAYGPLTKKTTLAPYGSIPVPVAKVCSLTFICQYDDIHPRTQGYAIIAKLVVAALKPS